VLAAVLIATTTLTLPAQADAAELPQPQGEVVLMVTGAIEATNADGTARFDRQMLRDLPVTRYETGTIWTKGTHVFEGVLLGHLLDAVGADGEEVYAVALNDYAVTIPVGDGDTALVAFALDGNDMTVRNKGPLWIVYPFDSDPDFRTETIYSRSIWQLKSLDVRD